MMHNMPISGRIILAGNPNVGKSTLFNLLTGKKVHTGNWSGKTVSVSEGYGVHNNKKYIIEDLPGISSIASPDAEEIAAFNAIASGSYDCLILVADSSDLRRSLSLMLRITELTGRCVLFLNMYDEAMQKGISINTDMLSFILGVRVVAGSARSKSCLSPLYDAAESVICGSFSSAVYTPLYDEETENTLASFSYDRKETISHIYSSDSYTALKAKMSERVSYLSYCIEQLTVSKKEIPQPHRADKILSRPLFGIPFMLSLLFLVLYITVVASNYPSQLLSHLFSRTGTYLSHLLSNLGVPQFTSMVIIEGVYSTTSTVIAVMLPPMVIFFPLFAILEDSGILPRVAFNLDGAFKRCGSCGKQALTVCMGLGCNCVGVTNSAIIPSERERLISILTNSFTPCNGRFGAIIACISVFLAPKSPLLTALFMALVLVLSFASTTLSSYLLTHSLLRGKPSPFVLELPPFRRVNVPKVIAASLREHTLQILLRAIAVSAPMGAVIYILNHFSLLLPVASFLNPFASLMGLDGIILLAFILAFPANEIVFPVALMLYTQSKAMVEYSSHAMLHTILVQNGWSTATALSFIIFTLMHWPCSTTLLTIKKETHSIKWTLISVLLPLLFGIAFCFLSNAVFQLFSV